MTLLPSRAMAAVRPGRPAFARAGDGAQRAPVTAPPPPADLLLQDGAETHTGGNRFLLSAVAFLRTKQLKDGASARVARDGHKHTSIAVLEVLAHTVSWSRA